MGGCWSAEEPASVEGAKALLQKIVSSHDVVLFTAPVGPGGLMTCPYCSKAQAALKSAGITYHHQVVGTKGTNSRTALIDMCKGTATVPEAFFMGQWIGGWDETDGKDVREPWMGISSLIETGKLAKAAADRDFECLRTQTPLQ
eukprot:TRINITY_DN58290_c0_g1_i1.p1 TRINITY_DN58290_c0_g1~~TRINITY_DN58290_c0_g1_i1.p1  ORF type:complete len:144 (+),score=27.97 TRINITY_DN58290_c0_g1_i1:52-483(+)